MSKRNILIISDQMLSGGATSFMSGLLQELAKNKHLMIHFIYFQEQNLNLHHPLPNSSHIIYHPISIKNSYRFRSVFYRTLALKKILIQIPNINFDFVFTDLVYPTLAFIIAKKFYQTLAKVPIYHHIHGSFSEEKKSQLAVDRFSLPNYLKHRIFIQTERFVLLNCQKIFVSSNYSKKLTSKLHGQNLPIHINKPGVDPTLPKSVRLHSQKHARQILGLSPDQKYILCTSRIEPRKGVLQFFQYLPNSLSPNHTLIVCNQFASTPWLYSFFSTLDNTKLGSKILLINSPSREEIALLYRASNVTIMPSIGLETFGFTTLESYYYNTPVVAFNIAANSELVPKKFLVKYSTSKDFIKLYQKTIDTIKSHPKIDYSQFNFSWKNYVANLLASTNDNPKYTPNF